MTDFINKVNDNGLINLQIACIRDIKCKKCLKKNDVCKMCDVELYSRIYLNVKYDEKDEAKKLEIKWYMYKDNKNIAIILKKWNKLLYNI